MEGKLLIQNGRVLPMTGKVIPKGSVLVENGKITAVAERIEVPDTGSTEIIDASGCLVMPGLIEAHCHVGITEEKKGMEGDDCNENVSPVTPWLRAIDAVNTWMPHLTMPSGQELPQLWQAREAPTWWAASLPLLKQKADA